MTLVAHQQLRCLASAGQGGTVAAMHFSSHKYGSLEGLALANAVSHCADTMKSSILQRYNNRELIMLICTAGHAVNLHCSYCSESLPTNLGRGNKQLLNRPLYARMPCSGL